MEYTSLGDSGLEVSRLVLGGANFGDGAVVGDQWQWTIDDEETSCEIIHRALDAGVNVIDTATGYSLGGSEEVIGRAIEGRRDEVVLATKVGGPMADRPNAAGTSRKHLIEQCRKSLDRLGTDYLDLLQLHVHDPETPLDETLSALDYLVNEGLVRYVGASNYPGWRVQRALDRSELRGWESFTSLQPRYNLVQRAEEGDSLPVADANGVGVLPYSPLATGFLAGVYERGDAPPEDERLDHAWAHLDRERNWETLDRVRELADEKGVTPVQVSVAWVLHQDVVDAPIVGPRSVAELEEYLGALDVTLSDDEQSYLEAPIAE